MDNMAMDAGVVIALLGLMIIIAGHLCTTVWWMSRITTTLLHLSSVVDKAVNRIEGLVPKVDCDKTHCHLDKEVESIWDAIEKKADK